MEKAAKRKLEMSLTPLVGEYAYNVRLSPNGCKAVFGRVPDWNPETWKPISIITLCKGE